MHQIDINIEESVKKTISEIVKKFKENGFKCYLVGGSVRDLVLKRQVYDYDFATDALPEQISKLFKRVIPTGMRHGTVTVLEKGKSFEITTFRSDGEYSDGRRPENVFFSKSLEEDISRRDFTINGLAYDIEKDEIIDLVNGIEDIFNSKIRTIGNPIERFSEDGLRTYRACRFASKLNFEIVEETFKAIESTLDIASTISAERIRDEFTKILETDTPSIGLEYLRKSGLLKIFLPELYAGFEVEQNKFHIHDVYYHSIYSCDAAHNDKIIRLAALLHDIGKVPSKRMGTDNDATFYNHEIIGYRMAKKIMKRLKYSNEEIEKVTNLVSNHMFHYTDDWTDGAVRRFMRKVGVENIDDLLELRLADRKGNGSRDGMPAAIAKLQERIAKIIEEENAISVKDLKINGNDIMTQFQILPGPIIGKILKDLLERVLDDPEINNRDKLLELAKEFYSSNVE